LISGAVASYSYIRPNASNHISHEKKDSVTETEIAGAACFPFLNPSIDAFVPFVFCSCYPDPIVCFSFLFLSRNQQKGDVFHLVPSVSASAGKRAITRSYIASAGGKWDWERKKSKFKDCGVENDSDALDRRRRTR
jgi:hypothetical protein